MEKAEVMDEVCCFAMGLKGKGASLTDIAFAMGSYHMMCLFIAGKSNGLYDGLDFQSDGCKHMGEPDEH